MKYSHISGLLAALWITPAGAQTLDLPSGTQAALYEVLVDETGDETWLRFRFIAPTIDRVAALAPTYDDLEADFPHICETFVTGYLQEFSLPEGKIVISLADRVLEFGTSDPEATQYFEVFRLKGADCIWEGL